MSGREETSMIRNERDLRWSAGEREGDGNGAGRIAAHDDSLGTLLKSLSSDASNLARQEVRLAKMELREMTHDVASTLPKLGIAFVLALAGTFAFTAFMIIALGDALDNYWLSALIVGVALLLVGGVLANRAIAALKSVGAPRETAETLQEDAAWAREEVGEFKRDLTRQPARQGR
jgi:uncharacterized membrane protein YqjE